MLATLEELKLYLWITDSDSDDVLNQLLAQSQAFIQSYTGRDLIATDYTKELYSWKAEREFQLKQFPIITVAEKELALFQYNNWTLWTPVWVDFDVDSYRADKEAWIVLLWFNLLRGFQNIQVTYKAWFETIPADLNLAAIRLSAYYYNTRNSDWILSESVDGASIRFDAKQTPADVLAVLENYKSF